MKLNRLAIALIFAAVPLHAAHANNRMILLDKSDLSQRAVLDITGDANRLLIVQRGPAAPEVGNSISVSIDGNGNGGAQGKSFSGGPASVGLTPGSFIQTGFGNSIEVGVVGDRNLFAVAQLGNRNTVQAAIRGSDNQAAVMQTGAGNFASIAQNGIGNIISVQQTNW